MQIAEIFRGKVVDVTKRAMIIEITGTTDKIAAFESDGAAVRADRDDAHGRDRDLARAQRDLALARPTGARAPVRARRRRIASGSPRGCAWRSAGRAAHGLTDARAALRWPCERDVDPVRGDLRLAARRASAGSCSSSPTAAEPRWRALGETVSLSRAGRAASRTSPRAGARCAAAAVVDPAEEPPGPGRSRSAASRSPPTAAAPRTGRIRAGVAEVPEVTIIAASSGTGGRAVRLTLAALASPDDLPEELLARLESRLAELRQAPLPLLDPAPAGRFQVASAMPPEHYEQAVGGRGELIARGRAREDRARARSAGPRARAVRPGCGRSASCARSSPPASCSASGAATPR